MEAALKAWDVRRGAASWDVVYCDESDSVMYSRPEDARTVQPAINVLHNIHVPSALSSSEEGGVENGDYLNELFEWVGMACLGSQRCVLLISQICLVWADISI